MPLRHLLAAAILIVVPAVFTAAQTSRSRVIPFTEFIRNVKLADSHEFLTRPASNVQDLAAFEEMRQYILALYHGVHINRSYVTGSQTFDCIPIDQQPSLRDRGKDAAPEPPLSGTLAPPTDSPCEDHTIPMRRVTLDQLCRFKTLHEFFAKGPNGSVDAPKPQGKLR